MIRCVRRDREERSLRERLFLGLVFSEFLLYCFVLTADSFFLAIVTILCSIYFSQLWLVSSHKSAFFAQLRMRPPLDSANPILSFGQNCIGFNTSSLGRRKLVPMHISASKQRELCLSLHRAIE
jgi:hypothetical protein